MLYISKKSTSFIVSMRITKSPCTAFPLARKVVAQFLPTKIVRRNFQLANQHNILVVWVFLLTIRRIYWSGWLYDRQSFARQFSSLWHRFAPSSTPSLFNFLGPGRQQQSNMQTAELCG